MAKSHVIIKHPENGLGKLEKHYKGVEHFRQLMRGKEDNSFFSSFGGEGIEVNSGILQYMIANTFTYPSLSGSNSFDGSKSSGTKWLAM